jgi:hypothetical protein
MDLYDCNYGPVLNTVKNLVSSCVEMASLTVFLNGAFENPDRLLMRLCAELYIFWQKIDLKHCTLQQHTPIRSRKCKELFPLT